METPSSETIELDQIITEQDNFVSRNNSLDVDVFEDFVTGSGYTIGDRIITIDSDEGQILNQILIEQKKINRDNFFHMIKYLDRYSDGYVELAEALIDPVKKQQYQSSGISRDSYINSNLEHFLVERGYDLSNLDSIPNDAFSPTKYDDVRSEAARMSNNGADNVDLRELLPNYVKPDSKVMHDQMVRNLSEQTTNVYDSISSSRLEISVKQSPDLTNTISDNLFDDFQFVNTKFENTQHVIDSLDNSQNLFEINKTANYSILFSIPVILGLVIFGYFLYRKSLVKSPLQIVPVSASINYVENTISMIHSSRSLFDDGSPKYAFEKFSQAIRYYYSQKLQINLDLTPNETISELKKSKISNYDDVYHWLELCTKVEFVRHKSTQKEFIKALDSFSKSIS
jgi:molybdopterin converting factor small subunit